MAKLFVCAVRDSAMKAFAPPFCVPATGVAVRGFTNEVNRAEANNQVYLHPEDFELWELGRFEEETGEFEQSSPVCLVRGKDLKKES